MPNVGEGHRSTSINAKNFDTGKRSDDSHPKTEHICQRSYGNRHSRIFERFRHPFRHGGVDGGATPRPQHDEGVIDADAQHQEGGGHVDPNEGDSAVHDHTQGGQGGQNGRNDAQESQHGLGLDPVGHHAGTDAEGDHDPEVEGEVGYHRIGIVF